MVGIEWMISTQPASHCPYRKRHGLFDILSIRFVVRECICDDFFALRWEPTSASFLDARSTSVAWFVSSRIPVLLSQVARCFQMPVTSIVAAAAVANYSLTKPWVLALGVANLSEIARSPIWEVTRTMQLPGNVALVMISNDFVYQNRNPCTCALDNFIHYTTSWFRFQQVL